jgi:deazaflavin-dependent oxidoreductase (nitroreductase family)
MSGPPEALLKFANVAHKTLLKVSGGKLGWKMGKMPVVELTTIGRKSGEKRTIMLTAPIVDGDDVVLVASKGGADSHPAWYLNLQAQPEVDIVMGGKARAMRARTADAEERKVLWPQITSTYKGYAGYQTKTDREIPVVILEPR